MGILINRREIVLFLDLNDGRVINLDDVSMVKAFSAAAQRDAHVLSRYDTFFKDQIDDEYEKMKDKNAVIDYHSEGRLISLYIDETPSEFLAKANAVLSLKP